MCSVMKKTASVISATCLTWEFAYGKMELNLGMRVERYLQFCSIEIHLAACDYSEKFSGNLNTNKNMTSMFGNWLIRSVVVVQYSPSAYMGPSGMHRLINGW